MNWKDTCSIILTSIDMFIVVGGIVGNFFILILIIRKKKSDDLTNYFIFNLSLADLAISIFVIPFSLPSLNNVWIPKKWDCTYLMPILEHFAGVCVLTHTAISLVRYLVVSQNKIVQAIKLKHIVFVIGLIWLVAFAIISASMMGGLGRFILNNTSGTNKTEKMTCDVDFYGESIRKYVYAIMIFSLTYIIPMVCTGFSYYRIYKVVSDNAKSLKGMVTNDLLVSRKRSSKRLNRILLTMYIFFGSTTLPIQVLYLIEGVTTIGNIFKDIWPVTFTLFYLQVVTNPLVLLYMRTEYRKELYKISFCFCFSRHYNSHHNSPLRINKGKIKGKSYYKQVSMATDKQVFVKSTESHVFVKQTENFFAYRKYKNRFRLKMSGKQTTHKNVTFSCTKESKKISLVAKTKIEYFPQSDDQVCQSKNIHTDILNHSFLESPTNIVPNFEFKCFLFSNPQKEANLSDSSSPSCANEYLTRQENVFERFDRNCYSFSVDKTNDYLLDDLLFDSMKETLL
ncbi:galanin receptor type 1 isoform X1 [Hydra vulgaris]|uniref:galanin receptor type 1 isoform X1 n=1 Tax=Hydra vulgaris TaxID=6087 RepID=UPI0002B45699|nr:galanin receptor type 1 isoform X1 [Hydra vulgaris]XP_012567020.1 galanin receptor type 1 isoform X1 [Hydra vulgaris]XP_047143748.1 galanin receptor type 1 isoform X1 [Hydra vulgaris]